VCPSWFKETEGFPEKKEDERTDGRTNGRTGFREKKEEVLSFKFLGFLGDGFGVKGRMGVWVVVLSPSFVSHHQFLQPI
jgi:hypothetical protein